MTLGRGNMLNGCLELTKRCQWTTVATTVNLSVTFYEYRKRKLRNFKCFTSTYFTVIWCDMWYKVITIGSNAVIRSVDLPVSSRIDEMISAARAKENQSPRKPRDESLEASLPLPLPEDCTGDKAKCDGDISKERIRAKISPTFSILSAVRYMGSLRYKHSEHAERNGLQNTLGSATILQSRHSSSVASYSVSSQDEKSFIADSRGNSAVPSLPSPRAKAVGISACESEEGAYLYRAGRTTLEEDQNK